MGGVSVTEDFFGQKAIAAGLAFGGLMLAIKLFRLLFAWDARRIEAKKQKKRDRERP